MLLIEEIRRLLRQLIRRLGRRGGILLVCPFPLAVGFAGILVSSPTPAMRISFGAVVPLTVWAVLWAATAVAVAVGAFSLRDRWAYVSAIAMVTVWALQSLASWWPLGTVPLGWVSALIYAGFAGMLLIIAGWREQVLPETALARGHPDAVVTADEHGLIVGWHGAAQDVFGWAGAEIIGRPITTIMPERYIASHHAAVARLRKTGRVGLGGRTIYGHGLHRDGQEVPISLYVAVTDTGSGPVMSAVIRPAPPYGLPYVIPAAGPAASEPGS